MALKLSIVVGILVIFSITVMVMLPIVLHGVQTTPQNEVAKEEVAKNGNSGEEVVPITDDRSSYLQNDELLGLSGGRTSQE